MLRAAAMKKVRMCILERDMDRVTKALGELGALHLVSSVEESEGRLEAEHLDQEVARCRDLLERARRLAERMAVETPEAPSVGDLKNGTDEAERLVGALEGETAALAERVESLEQALGDTEEIVRELAPFRDVDSPLSRLADSTFLEVRAGAVPLDRFAAMREAMPAGTLVIPLDLEEAERGLGPVMFLAVGSRRRRFAMETVLGQHGFEQKRLPAYEERSPRAICAEAAARRRELQERLRGPRGELLAAGQRWATELRRSIGCLTVRLTMLEAQQQFGATWAMAVISGWVPAERAGDLREALLAAAQGRAVVELFEPDARDIEEGRVPSSLTQNRWLAPFERLVRGFGVAGYTEIEPTLMFAASFLLLFGLIFGDLGHGLCLMAVGLFVRRKARSLVIRDGGYVAAASGLAAAAFGLFFQGRFFGLSLGKMGFPLTLGFEPIRLGSDAAGAGGHVVRYVLLAMGFGMIFISLGVVLNVINRLRNGDYEAALLGRFGAAGIAFYWGVAAVALKLATRPGPWDGWLAAGLVGVPLALVALREPLYGIAAGRRPLWADGPVVGLFEGLVHAMEAAMTYLANTCSFMRVAAFALSHAVLCFTILVLRELVADLPGGPLWSALVFVVGTATVIGLEGLIVVIQIVRLEYYEFFTKFFRGEGLQYRPFSLAQK